MLQASVVVFILSIFAFLATEYPYILQDEHDRTRYLFILVVLLLVALAVPPFLYNKNIPKSVTRILAWIGVGYAMILAYSLHNDLKNSTLIAELFPKHAKS